jgi:hypothetical protein
VEDGFIAGDHICDERGHSGDNILAGGGESRRSSGTSVAAIAISE